MRLLRYDKWNLFSCAELQKGTDAIIPRERTEDYDSRNPDSHNASI